MTFFGLFNYTRCHTNNFKKKTLLLPKKLLSRDPTVNLFNVYTGATFKQDTNELGIYIYNRLKF